MKENYWFRLDCDFLSDPKVQDIHFSIGNDAIVAYLVTVIRLYKEGGSLRTDKYKQIAYEAHTTEDVVRKVVEEFGLFLFDGESFHSKRVLEELESQKKISAQRSVAGKKGVQKRIANAQANAYTNDKQMVKQNSNKREANYQLPITNNSIDNTLGSSLHSEPCPTENQSDAEKPVIFPETQVPVETKTEVLSNKHCQQVVDFWNRKVAETGAQFPQVKSMSEDRKKKIRIRWEEFKRIGNPVDVCRTLFEKATASKFLQGDNPKGWSANFDWIFTNGKNWLKIYEGNYDNAPAGMVAGTGAKSRIDALKDDLEYIDRFFDNGKQQTGTTGIDDQ